MILNFHKIKLTLTVYPDNICINLISLIKSGRGKGPVKPGNLQTDV
jgi:hypothetical protein